MGNTPPFIAMAHGAKLGNCVSPRAGLCCPRDANILFMKSRAFLGCVCFLLFYATYISNAGLLPAKPLPLRYSVIRLGTPSTPEVSSPKFMYPRYINNKGDVIGTSGGGIALYRDGTIYELGYPRAPLDSGEVWGINDRGEILGLAFGEWPVAFVLLSFPQPLPATEARILPVLSFLPYDLNNYGTVIGTRYDPEQDKYSPVIYRDGRVTQPPPLVPGGYASPRAINNRGQILGEATIPDINHPFGGPRLRAVIWSGGRIINLGVLPGCFDSFGRDINDRGEAVGECTSSDAYVGFIYRNGVMRPVPSPPGARHTLAGRINNAGDVLIHVVPWGGNDEVTFPYLYADGALHDLTTMVARATRWRVTTLYLSDINDRGEIVGLAEYRDRNNRAATQGILLVPDHKRNRSSISRLNDRLVASR
jgi:hypothetical protein